MVLSDVVVQKDSCCHPRIINKRALVKLILFDVCVIYQLVYGQTICFVNNAMK